MLANLGQVERRREVNPLWSRAFRWFYRKLTLLLSQSMHSWRFTHPVSPPPSQAPGGGISPQPDLLTYYLALKHSGLFFCIRFVPFYVSSELDQCGLILEILDKRIFLFSALKPSKIEAWSFSQPILSHQEGAGLRMSLLQKKTLTSNDNT